MMLLQGSRKRCIIAFRMGFEVVVEIPIDESGGRSPIEKDGKIFFFAKGD